MECEAYEAARLIRDAAAGTGLQLPGAAGPRPPGYEDFALLLRSTGNQIVYERVFRRFGIPYTTENIRTLFLEAPVNDMYAALQCCIYPRDREAYAVYLRSFFVNLSDEALLTELLDEGLPFAGDPERFAPAEAEKYCLGRELYNRLGEMIDRVPHREVLRFLWYEAGYRYNLVRNPAWHGYLEFYEYLIALADKSWDAGESMVLFLDFLRENLGDYKKLEEIEILRTREEGVRIMTIHKSKGLEFPIVLLASTGQGSNESGKRSPYYLDDSFGLTVNMAVPGTTGNARRQKPNPFYEGGVKASRQMEAAELKRLLYVACTRAEQHLIMLGYSPKRKSSGLPSLLDLIFSGLNSSAENPESPFVRLYGPVPRSTLYRLGAETGTDGDRRQLLHDYERLTREPPFTMPRFNPPLSVSRLNGLFTGLFGGEAGMPLAPLPVDPLIIDREELFGTLVHHVLEGMITGKNPERFDSLLAGFSSVEADQLVTCAQELARGFWKSSFRREQMPDGTAVFTEVPFTLGLEIGEKRHLVEGVIDLFADRGNEIVCVDFKTNRYRISREYAVQMWFYRRALEKLCKKPVRTYLFYLREGVPREELSEIQPEELEQLFSAALEKK
ncbi:3'-5' exonuclease [Marispirochaeta sp.]|uniref:3'-5' exonuclease n=1 Tax=Marispirochaeta sp. TaxID=2038653 RepID=UPI0029C7C7C2|nr:3'-5' exonuclease [Marispirochaeta sp.]